ncbi:MAG: sterol desaturase family protein [Luteolibacter sp.]
MRVWVRCSTPIPQAKMEFAKNILIRWQEQIAAMPAAAFYLLNGLVLAFVIFVPLERIFPLHRQTIFRRGFLRDVGLYFLNNLLPAILLLLPLSLVVGILSRFIPAGYLAWVKELPYWVKLLAAFVVGDIGSYWGHRWSHEWPTMWRFHLVHHRAEELDWLVNVRMHPLDTVFTRFCGMVPIYLLGLAQVSGNSLEEKPLLVVLVTSLWGYFVHANVRWRFGWLEQIIATPAFHHWHHNNDGPDKFNKNYAANFPWIDRLFGTLYLPPKDHPLSYGVDEKQNRTS